MAWPAPVSPQALAVEIEGTEAFIAEDIVTWLPGDVLQVNGSLLLPAQQRELPRLTATDRHAHSQSTRRVSSAPGGRTSRVNQLNALCSRPFHSSAPSCSDGYSNRTITS